MKVKIIKQRKALVLRILHSEIYCSTLIKEFLPDEADSFFLFLDRVLIETEVKRFKTWLSTSEMWSSAVRQILYQCGSDYLVACTFR